MNEELKELLNDKNINDVADLEEFVSSIITESMRQANFSSDDISNVFRAYLKYVADNPVYRIDIEKGIDYNG